jgi:hypothetical protein
MMVTDEGDWKGGGRGGIKKEIERQRHRERDTSVESINDQR